MKNISATIITYNEEQNIATCIKNLKELCNEIIIVDSYSNDNTIKIAKKLGAKVHLQKFLGDGPQKKLSADLASNNWVLSIDADEVLTEEAKKIIKNLDLSNKKVVFAFRRKNFLGEKWLKSIYPDYKIRLYNKKFSYYTDRKIHSAVKYEKKIKLKADIIHPTFKDYKDWIDKLNYYSTKEALHLIAARNKKPVTYATILSHSLASFIKKFFLQGGIFKGIDGLMGSVTISFHTFAKYIKMLEIQEKKQQPTKKF